MPGFLQAMLDAGAYTWFAKIIAVGELVIGIASTNALLFAISTYVVGAATWHPRP